MNAFSYASRIPALPHSLFLGLLLLTSALARPVKAQSLPYHGTATSSSTLWWITQLGLGSAGEFEINNASNANPALLAVTTGSGAAIKATAGSGLAGDFGGKVKMTGFQLSTSPVSGYVLTSDASGNGVWKKLPADSDAKYYAGAGLLLSGTTFSIATGGVVSSMLAAGAVTSSALASGAVTTAAVADGAVTAAKLSWPLSETAANANALFSVTNSGSGGGGSFVSGGNAGVYGQSNSGPGVSAYSTSGDGVSAYSASGGAGGSFVTDGGGDGVYGQSASGNGGEFHGETVGVYGIGTGGGLPYGGYFVSGVYGAYGNGGLFGVWGESPYNGVAALATASNANGVNAECDNGVGVLATADYGEAVWGQSKYGWAGYFLGDADVTGGIYAAAKYFKIDHPLDPANKYLVHACVESDQMTNVYSGNVALDANGQATVALPDWFEALNKDFRYQLTCIGGFAPVFIAQEIQNGRFQIGGGKPGMKVSWQVTGVRQDAYATAHPLQVEQEKPEDRRGKYLHPKENGQSESLGEDYNRKLSLKQLLHGQLSPPPAPGR